MLWRRKALVCRRAVDLVTAYLEDALSTHDRARFEAHLQACPHCREYVKQMRDTLSIIGRIEPNALEPAAQTELVALYRQWLRG